MASFKFPVDFQRFNLAEEVSQVPGSVLTWTTYEFIDTLCWGLNIAGESGGEERETINLILNGLHLPD